MQIELDGIPLALASFKVVGDGNKPGIYQNELKQTN